MRGGRGRWHRGGLTLAGKLSHRGQQLRSPATGDGALPRWVHTGPEAGTRGVASRWHGGGLHRKLQAGPHPRNVRDPRVSTGRLGAETSLPHVRNLSTVLRLLLLGIAPFLQPPGPAQSGLRDLGNQRGRDPGKVTGMEEEGGGDRNPSGSAGPFCGLIRTFPRSGHILGAKGTDMAGKRPPTSGTGLGEGARWQAPEQTAPS